jgi:hypothetical protein
MKWPAASAFLVHTRRAWDYLPLSLAVHVLPGHTLQDQAQQVQTLALSVSMAHTQQAQARLRLLSVSVALLELMKQDQVSLPALPAKRDHSPVNKAQLHVMVSFASSVLLVLLAHLAHLTLVAIIVLLGLFQISLVYPFVHHVLQDHTTHYMGRLHAASVRLGSIRLDQGQIFLQVACRVMQVTTL